MLVPVLLSTFAFSTLTFLVMLGFYKYWFTYWKKMGVNYLKPSFPFGNATGFFLGKISFGELFRDWYLEIKKRGWALGGTYFCGKPILIPVDNELIKKILVSDFISFPNHGMYLNEKVDPFSGHIFNLEGYRWKNLRAKFPSAFTAVKMRRNVIIMESLSKDLISRLDQMSRESINIRDVLIRFTTDIITACAFGMESKTLKNQNEELLKQARPFFESQWSRTKNTLVLLVPIKILSFFRFKLFPTDTTRYFMNMFQKIKIHRQTESTKRNDLADLLIDLCDETKNHPDFNGEGNMDPLTFNEFATQMLVFFEAGFETSSSTQTLAMYELAANPDIQDKLRYEINSVLEKYNGKVGYEAVQEMEYLERVVDETLRKYPIFPMIARLCKKDYPIPDTSITIKKDEFVMVTNYGIQHDPEYYPDPMKFDPERWTPENKSKRPFCSYLAFGEGPRICVGKRFGLWQTKIGILSIVRNYKISLSKKMKLPFSLQKTGLILRAEGDVWIDLEKISTKENASTTTMRNL